MSDKANKSQGGAKKSREQSIVTKIYLLAYNFGQVFG